MGRCDLLPTSDRYLPFGCGRTGFLSHLMPLSMTDGLHQRQGAGVTIGAGIFGRGGIGDWDGPDGARRRQGDWRAAPAGQIAGAGAGARRVRASCQILMTTRPGACGHIAIYHSPAYVFIIAMPLQSSFRRKPGSSVVISCYGNGAGKHRFRLSPE